MTTGKSEERTKWEVSNIMILYVHVLYKHATNSFIIIFITVEVTTCITT